jgi:hypothetical protein
MAAKKKTTKKTKRAARKKATPAKARSPKAKKRSVKVAKREPAPKRAEKKKVAAAKPPRNRERVAEVAFPSQRRDLRSGEESGDLQGLSDREAADSESVDELIEEGNAFEADVVAGVESADDSDEKEVHTHEVPEDDVPGEYLDED